MFEVRDVKACGIALAFAVLATGGCARPQTGGQQVAISVTDEGFTPSTVRVRRGEPVTLVITRRTDATCATAAVFAGSGKSYTLPLNKPVRIPIPSNRAATIDFACPMDMYRGKVIVQ